MTKSDSKAPRGRGDGHSLRRSLVRFHAEPDPLVRLQDLDDLQDIVRPGIAARPEYAVHALVRLLELLCELLKSDGRVDVVAKHGLARIKIAGEQFVC